MYVDSEFLGTGGAKTGIHSAGSRTGTHYLARLTASLMLLSQLIGLLRFVLRPDRFAIRTSIAEIAMF